MPLGVFVADRKCVCACMECRSSAAASHTRVQLVCVRPLIASESLLRWWSGEVVTHVANRVTICNLCSSVTGGQAYTGHNSIVLLLKVAPNRRGAVCFSVF